MQPLPKGLKCHFTPSTSAGTNIPVYFKSKQKVRSGPFRSEHISLAFYSLKSVNIYIDIYIYI